MPVKPTAEVAEGLNALKFRNAHEDFPRLAEPEQDTAEDLHYPDHCYGKPGYPMEPPERKNEATRAERDPIDNLMDFWHTVKGITLWQLLGVLPMALVLWVSLGLMLDPALSRDNAIACYVVRHQYFCNKTKEDMAAFMVNIEKRTGGGKITGYAAMPQGPDPLKEIKDKEQAAAQEAIEASNAIEPEKAH